MRKMMETIVLFGDIFGAKRMVEVTHKEGHLVTSFGIPLLKPLFKTMEELNKEDNKVVSLTHRNLDLSHRIKEEDDLSLDDDEADEDAYEEYDWDE